MMTLILVLHFMVCFVLIAVVLLQRGKGADLGAALGAGGANTVFGSRGAGNFLTRLTTGSAIIFMLTSLSLAYLDTERSDVRLFDEGLENEQNALPDSQLEEIPTDEASTGDLEEVEFDEVNTLEEADPAAGKAPASP